MFWPWSRVKCDFTNTCVKNLISSSDLSSIDWSNREGPVREPNRDNFCLSNILSQNGNRRKVENLCPIFLFLFRF